MNTTRISLDSPSLSGRIKKFDTYQQLGRNTGVNSRPVQRPITRQAQAYGNLTRQNIPRDTSSALPLVNNKAPISGSRNLDTRAKLIALQTIPLTKSRFNQQFESISTDVYKNKKHRYTKFQIAFYGFGISMFIFAGAVSVQTLLTNKQAQEQVNVLGANQTVDEQGVIEGSGSEPAEADVPQQAITNYRVDPELPRYLRIPELGIVSRIKHTGVTKEGAIDAPANINDVSWYNESARPGNEIGSALLLGHVSGWTASGVFKQIDKLKAGMRFEVEKGSGEKLTYEVTRGEKIPVDQLNMAHILESEVAGEHDLKLMTCSGKYNRETKQYEDRYIVYAKILR